MGFTRETIRETEFSFLRETVNAPRRPAGSRWVPLGSCACKFLWTRLHVHAIKDSIRVKNEPGFTESRLRVHGASVCPPPLYSSHHIIIYQPTVHPLTGYTSHLHRLFLHIYIFIYIYKYFLLFYIYTYFIILFTPTAQEHFVNSYPYVIYVIYVCMSVMCLSV